MTPTLQRSICVSYLSSSRFRMKPLGFGICGFAWKDQDPHLSRMCLGSYEGVLNSESLVEALELKDPNPHEGAVFS